MNDIVDSARSARQKLATALGLLQAPETIAFLDTVASPVARAMGALHRIESTNGEALPEGGPAALAAVREALGALQSVPEGNPTLDQASEQVAGSLGLVHALAQRATAIAAAPTAAPPAVAPVTPASVPPQAGFTKTSPSVAPEAPRPQFAKTTPSVTPEAEGHVHVSQPPVGAFDKTAMASQSPVAHLEIPRSPSQSPPGQPGLGHTQETPPFQAAQQQAAPIVAPHSAAPAQHAVPHAAPQATAVSPAVAQQRPASIAPTHDHPADSKHAPAPSEVPNTGVQVVEANLGAHSPTNFYKGLSGNDVIVDGGLFVATYNIPPLGSRIWLRVTLPGGYDFEASAEVRWTRESGVGDAPPGFGASLISLSAEARQLVQRYVRNREPLFHDDL